MRKWILRWMVWYLRRRGGEASVFAPTYRTERRHKRKYHVVLLREQHYHALKANTTWTRGDSL